MKRIIVLFFLLHGLLFAQVGFITEFETLTDYQKVKGIVEAQDRGVVVLAEINDGTFPVQNQDFLVVKYTPLGGVEWAYRYPVPGNEEAISILSMGEEGFMLAGSTDSLGPGAGNMLLMRITEEGAPIGAQLLGTPDEVYQLQGLLITQQGKIALGGWRKDSASAIVQHGFTGLLNPAGSFDWAYRWDSTVYAHKWPAVTPDGDLVFTGIQAVYGLKGMLTKISMSGVVKQNLGYTFDPVYADDYFEQVAVLSDGSMAIGGYFNGGPAFHYPSLLMRVDTAGNPMWVSSFNYSNNDGSYGYSVDLDSQENIYFTCRHGACFVGDHASVAKYSPQGVKIGDYFKAKRVVIGQNDMLLASSNYVSSTPGGGNVWTSRFPVDQMVTCGGFSYRDTRDSIFPTVTSRSPGYAPVTPQIEPLAFSRDTLAFNFQVDCQVMVAATEASQPNSVSLFPNPANDRFTVRYPGDFHLRLISPDGRELRTQKGRDRVEVDISKGLTGIYFVEIVGEAGEKVVKKLSVVR